ncbi:hypothetical protein [Salmonirosea aquatica]|uniref:Uncharacterized protein n=1 Tax=Salmonirosea aquatica TaxID=2654236 RepID=A0A7C9FQA3_9BACT|nr:hypothetical protein [Cytophagaceae bacterium SJW1-29]
MANNVNLGTARVLTAAIRHTINNDYKFNTLGAVAAVQDPAFNEIRAAINPKMITDSTSLAWRNIGSRQVPILHVDVTYNPQGAGGAVLTERLRVDPAPVEAGAATTLTVKYDYHVEKHFKQDVRKELLEPRAQQYIADYLAGKMRLDATLSGYLGNIGAKMYRDMEPWLFRPYNKYVLQQLIARVGKNKAYPGTVLPTAAAPLVLVNGYEAKGPGDVALIGPREVLMNTRTMNKFGGKGVLIGGGAWMRWHRSMAYMVANNDGVDFAKVYAQLPWVFYYDEDIDTEYGQDQAIYIDPGAVAFEQVSAHDRSYTYLKDEDFENYDTSLGMAYLSINQFSGEMEPGQVNVPSALPFALDLRVQRGMDVNDLPTKIWKPSISAGNFIRPLGFFTSDASNVFKDVSGVFGFKMVTYTAP